MNKKGFTLIELLAVILILGVIALIAVPTVNSIIKQIRITSNVTSSNNLVNAIINECEKSRIQDKNISGVYDIDDAKKLVTGSVNVTGSYEIDGNCNVSLAIMFNDDDKYCYTKDYDEEDAKYVSVPDASYCLSELKGTTPSSCFTYAENNGELEITGYKCGGVVTEVTGDTSTNLSITSYNIGSNMDVVIPNTINGKKVTSIKDGAFSIIDLNDNTIDLTKKIVINSLTIPSNIKTINASAFYPNKINNLILSSGTKLIKENAFRSNNISNLTLGDEISEIGSYAFAYNNSLIDELILPDSLIKIYDSGFAETKINSLVMGTNLEELGSKAFYKASIKNIKWNNKISKMDPYAFYGISISELTLPSSLTSLEHDVFGSNGNLALVNIPDSITKLDYNVFIGIGSRAVINIGSGIEKIGTQSFGCWHSGCAMTININRIENAVPGATWSSNNAVVNWTGTK